MEIGAQEKLFVKETLIKRFEDQFADKNVLYIIIWNFGTKRNFR